MSFGVDLGVLDECESWFLTSKFFPSKVGGKPAWLDLKELPPVEQLQCEVCKDPMVMVCQVYAPIEDKPSCFHRTIFLFICRNGSCCKINACRNMKVFRSQLQRHNDYYSPDPPEEKEDGVACHPLAPPLCLVCGCTGNAQCGGCHAARYCCKVHQVSDWRGGHKLICKDITAGDQTAPLAAACRGVLFKEWLLDIEPEPADPVAKKETEQQADKRRAADYERLVSSGKAGSLADTAEGDLLAFSDKQDKAFSQFKKRISKNPKQVLRYDRGGQPLWIASQPVLALENVPPCETCGGSRVFEFQIMPQLLNSLGLDITENSLDWGVICVYTCKDSCVEGPAYKPEAVYKQDVGECIK